MSVRDVRYNTRAKRKAEKGQEASPSDSGGFRPRSLAELFRSPNATQPVLVRVAQLVFVPVVVPVAPARMGTRMPHLGCRAWRAGGCFFSVIL